MVRGFMAANGVGELRHIESTKTADVYVTVLEVALLWSRRKPRLPYVLGHCLA